MAQQWDQRSFFDACDGGTGCHQETWSLQGLQEGIEGLWESKASGEVSKGWLALLDRTSKGSRKSRKTSKKAKEANARAKEAKGATKVPKDPTKAAFQVDLEKAKKAAKEVQGKMTAAASKMFTFYLNLLSPESKYSWNKIVLEQTESDLYVNLQDVSYEGPRGMSRELF